MSLWQPIRRSGHPYRARTMLGLGLFATLNMVCCLAVVPTEQAQGPQPPEPPPPPPPPPQVAIAACTVGTAPPVPAALRTFYVDATTGNDAASGTTTTAAWKTLDKANATARPGDLFLLAGTFTGQWIHPERSGTADHKIVFKALGTTPAVLDGGRYDGVVLVDGLSHIVVDGLELRNAAYPVSIQKGASNIWLRNVYLHSSPNQGVTIRTSSDNRIEDSRIDHIGSEANNAGEGIFLQDGANRNVIARNTIAYAGHGVIWIGYQASNEATSDDNLIEGNDLSNPWASGVGLNGKARRTVVQCNRIHNTADGSGVNTSRASIEIEGDSNVIRFNEIFLSGRSGITIQGRTFAGFVQNATNNLIYNNTLWKNGKGIDKSSGTSGFGSLELVMRDIGNVRNNFIENNIFWDDYGLVDGTARYAITFNTYFVDIPLPIGSMNGNIVRNNIFPAGQSLVLVVNRGVANQAYPMTRAEATFPGWGRNMQADPLFLNEALNDVRLRPGSPAIGAGVTVLGAAGLGSAPDLGAHQVR